MGGILLVYIAILAAAMSTFPALLVSYTVALIRWTGRRAGERILFQLGVLGLTFVCTTAMLIVVLFALLDWHALEVRVLGVDLMNRFSVIVPLVGCVPLMVVGEVAMAWASSRARQRAATGFDRSPR